MENIKWWRCMCHGCGKWFPASRKDAVACGANCRQRLCRARKNRRRDKFLVERIAPTLEAPHFIRKCDCAGCRAMDPFGAGSWLPAMAQKAPPPCPAPVATAKKAKK